jgi:hypothetical protein
MPVPSVPFMKVIAVYGSDDKSPFVNVLWYTSEDSPLVTQETVNGFALDFRGALTPIMQACLCTEANFFGVNCEINDGAGLAFSATSAPTLTPGTVSGDELPDYCAWIIRKHTAAPGKSGRGRWFIGGVPEVFTDTSRLLDSPRATECQALADFYLTPFSQTTPTAYLWNPALYSAKTNVLNLITGGVVVSVLGRQSRRRLRSLV